MGPAVLDLSPETPCAVWDLGQACLSRGVAGWLPQCCCPHRLTHAKIVLRRHVWPLPGRRGGISGRWVLGKQGRGSGAQPSPRARLGQLRGTSQFRRGPRALSCRCPQP